MAVSKNGYDFSPTYAIVQSRAVSVIALAKPSSGPLGGGTSVRISGSNFYNHSSVLCRFGDRDAVFVQFVSEMEILCISPTPDAYGNCRSDSGP